MASFGSGFFSDDWSFEQVNFNNDKLTWSGKQRVLNRKSKVSPIKVFERELLKDIDKILDYNYENPDTAVSILNVLTLN